mgnify:FL=1|tara:strand:+ start:13300 stop:13473 length:174 start_codon:yes stop_codon:yes gene_type:complete
MENTYQTNLKTFKKPIFDISKDDSKIYRGNANIQKRKKTKSIIRSVFYRGAEHQIIR